MYGYREKIVRPIMVFMDKKRRETFLSTSFLLWHWKLHINSGWIFRL